MDEEVVQPEGGFPEPLPVPVAGLGMVPQNAGQMWRTSTLYGGKAAPDSPLPCHTVEVPYSEPGSFGRDIRGGTFSSRQSRLAHGIPAMIGPVR